MQFERREFMAAGLGFLSLPSVESLIQGAERKYKVGACDWSIGKWQHIDAFSVAREIGLDGIQVSFGRPGDDFDLRDEKVRQDYRRASSDTGVEIASLAMGIFNDVPFAVEDVAVDWLSQCIDVMAAMGQKIVLVAFFAKGDIRGKPDLQEEVIRRLKRLAPKAEQAGVILGIESYLNVDDHLRILDGVGSPAVQVYYDVANMHYSGYDIFAEMRRLGRERICQIHLKELGHLLGQGPIDFPKIRDVLGEIGYQGWLIIEGATEKGRDVVDCYKENCRFVKELFAAE